MLSSHVPLAMAFKTMRHSTLSTTTEVYGYLLRHVAQQAVDPRRTAASHTGPGAVRTPRSATGLSANRTPHRTNDHGRTGRSADDFETASPTISRTARRDHRTDRPCATLEQQLRHPRADPGGPAALTEEPAPAMNRPVRALYSPVRSDRRRHVTTT
jgi:hypothetical protein